MPSACASGCLPSPRVSARVQTELPRWLRRRPDADMTNPNGSDCERTTTTNKTDQRHRAAAPCNATDIIFVDHLHRLRQVRLRVVLPCWNQVPARRSHRLSQLISVILLLNISWPSRARAAASKLARAWVASFRNESLMTLIAWSLARASSLPSRVMAVTATKHRFENDEILSWRPFSAALFNNLRHAHKWLRRPTRRATWGIACQSA